MNRAGSFSDDGRRGHRGRDTFPVNGNSRDRLVAAGVQGSDRNGTALGPINKPPVSSVLRFLVRRRRAFRNRNSVRTKPIPSQCAASTVSSSARVRDIDIDGNCLTRRRHGGLRRITGVFLARTAADLRSASKARMVSAAGDSTRTPRAHPAGLGRPAPLPAGSRRRSSEPRAPGPGWPRARSGWHRTRRCRSAPTRWSEAVGERSSATTILSGGISSSSTPERTLSTRPAYPPGRMPGR